MTEGFVIRPFQPSDTAASQSLIGELQSHELSLQTCLLPWETAKDAFWAWLQANIREKSGFIFLAEDKKTVVGLIAGWMGEDNYPCLKPEERRFGHVFDLVVTASARQKGVGAALMKFIEEFFLQRGVSFMRLTAFTNNKLADDFYLGYGMRHHVTTCKKHLVGAA